ncbi:hypothetical protein DPMN_169369 [Dreissena polymorpha]|uniref:Uncharacterized protein n=1 Tax=Dreissena polymorpha TaxID=45954 RepID=A0A9D4IDA9_DREPO|nr:hypothetical protein DPMN_169369 [Dreissena polymorpha]
MEFANGIAPALTLVFQACLTQGRVNSTRRLDARYGHSNIQEGRSHSYCKIQADIPDLNLFQNH